jgi:hypothetical protein
LLLTHHYTVNGTATHLSTAVLQHHKLLQLAPQSWLSRGVNVARAQHREGQVANEGPEHRRAKVNVMVAHGLHLKEKREREQQEKRKFSTAPLQKHSAC